MTTLYTTPSGYGRHRQAEPRGEESVPRSTPPSATQPTAPSAATATVMATVTAPAPAPVPVPVPVPVQGQAAHAQVKPPVPADPPIYRDVLSLWASQGRTLPGHRDQEWARLAAGPVWADRTVRVSGTLVRPGDGR
ncbi:hypothetical protein [Streptomyces sp. NRRL B-24572]|uniref:hypothetical protein n=1 Tax=Streptomyces sp. NRRL B-24572 TaxID=1962156 RepID=UPI00277D1702|nr:hypothetical protein [Streptomyces sp. NRRL B-24572]